MTDRTGREIDYLRVSVTDRCNLRCVYCMLAQGVEAVPYDELLTLEERETYSAYASWAQKSARCLDRLGVLLEDVSPADPGSRETAAAMLCRLMENTELIWD